MDMHILHLLILDVKCGAASTTSARRPAEHQIRSSTGVTDSTTNRAGAAA